MKNKFISVSLLFWAIVLIFLWRLLYGSFGNILNTQYVVYFALSCLVVYIVGIIVYFLLNKKYKEISLDINDDKERIYYESKLQYYVIAIIAVCLFSIILLFDIGGLADISAYLLGISIFALVFVYFYKVSIFTLGKDEFVWEKGSLKISCPWSDVLSINYDIAPALTNVGRNFKTTSFFVETKSGFTKYADLTNIKLKGLHTLFSQGEKLIKEIKLKSNAPERSGKVSMFKQTQKLKDVVFLLLGIFAIPVLIIILYCFFTGYKF